MAAVKGIALELVDQGSGAPIGPTVMRDIATFSPAPNHLKLRASLNAGPDGFINVSSYTSALQTVVNSGFDLPWLVIQGGTEEGYQKLKGAARLAAMPNAKLGYKGDPFLNPYIDILANKVVSFMDALPRELVPKYWFLWNEGNEDSITLQEGQDPGPNKPMSVAGRVWGAMLVTLTKRIKAKYPDTVLIPGSLSCLAKFFTDPAGDWVAGYLGLALDYINTHGVAAPYGFESLSLNLEGILSETYIEGCAKQLTAVMRKYGITGQTVIGEAGEHNEDLVGLDWSPTWQGLVKHMGVVFLYCWGTLDPTKYGCRVVGINAAGNIYPRDKTDFYDKFVAMNEPQAV